MSYNMCPNCGFIISDEKKEELKTKKGFVLLGKIVLFFAIYILISYLSDYKIEESKTEQEIRKEYVEKHFSSWDGSHRGLNEVIKEKMNDPNSLEHEKTTYVDKGDYLIIKTVFRGRNSFGGMVKHTVTANVDLEGNVMEIIYFE